MFEWEIKEEAGGGIVALLCRTRVLVSPGEGEHQGKWRWEVRFADGQTQFGFCQDRDSAFQKAKLVAERYMP